MVQGQGCWKQWVSVVSSLKKAPAAGNLCGVKIGIKGFSVGSAQGGTCAVIQARVEKGNEF